MSARTIAKLKSAVKRETDALAKLRDRLRDIEDEAGDLRSKCDDAIESLRYAIDQLSELV